MRSKRLTLIFSLFLAIISVEQLQASQFHKHTFQNLDFDNQSIVKGNYQQAISLQKKEDLCEQYQLINTETEDYSCQKGTQSYTIAQYTMSNCQISQVFCIETPEKFEDFDYIWSKSVCQNQEIYHNFQNNSIKTEECSNSYLKKKSFNFEINEESCEQTFCIQHKSGQNNQSQPQNPSQSNKLFEQYYGDCKGKQYINYMNTCGTDLCMCQYGVLQVNENCVAKQFQCMPCNGTAGTYSTTTTTTTDQNSNSTKGKGGHGNSSNSSSTTTKTTTTYTDGTYSPWASGAGVAGGVIASEVSNDSSNNTTTGENSNNNTTTNTTTNTNSSTTTTTTKNKSGKHNTGSGGHGKKGNKNKGSSNNTSGTSSSDSRNNKKKIDKGRDQVNNWWEPFFVLGLLLAAILLLILLGYLCIRACQNIIKKKDQPMPAQDFKKQITYLPPATNGPVYAQNITTVRSLKNDQSVQVLKATLLRKNITPPRDCKIAATNLLEQSCHSVRSDFEAQYQQSTCQQQDVCTLQQNNLCYVVQPCQQVCYTTVPQQQQYCTIQQNQQQLCYIQDNCQQQQVQQQYCIQQPVDTCNFYSQRSIEICNQQQPVEICNQQPLEICDIQKPLEHCSYGNTGFNTATSSTQELPLYYNTNFK